ncbi:MAG: PIN domain-containing protein [Anaerolineae bacterium]|nr:PIN domain-containing protein [Anaerolineae bacterium]
MAQLDTAILERAARLRATTDSLRLPDAIHLATATLERCDRFLTNDKRPKAVAVLPVVVLAEVG